MKQNYNFAIAGILKSEGGYSNNPSDPGGPTNFGITLADYRLHINANGTAEDVKHMDVSQAKAIYKSKYWDAVHGDDLPSGLDYTVFDYGVNSGVSRAKKVLDSFKDIPDTVAKIEAINKERMTFLKSLRTWPVFGDGWTNRVNRVRADSLRLAKGTSAVTPTIVVATGTVVAASTPIHYWPWIILGTVIVAFTAFIAMEIYEFRKNNKGILK